ncbi:MAG: hypothetical protein EWM73_03458 [Nitrospira sp.]|nr:MAG: hypothetical protein EWM73_03458 [Nitrospira sp.]
MGVTLAHPSRVSAELIPLRILIRCGIVCADLTYCWSGAVGASWCRKDGRGGFPP